MSRKRKKLFIQIYHDLYDSTTWRGMQWYSKLLYFRIKRKYNPRKGEKITVSYKEMEDEMSQPTFSKAKKELVERCLIRVTQKGGLYRRRNYYGLSEEWRLKQMSVPMVDIHKAKRGLVERGHDNNPTAQLGLVSHSLHA